MPKDKREELIRKAVAASLKILRYGGTTTSNGNADKQAKAKPAGNTSISPPQRVLVNQNLRSPSPHSANIANATRNKPLATENFFKANNQSIRTKDSPQHLTGTPETKTTLSPQQSEIASPRPRNQPEAYRPEGPVGIDIGTTSIVIAEGRGKNIHSIKQTKFTSSFPFDSYTKNVLFEHEVPYFEMSNFAYLQGYATETISNLFHGDPLWQYSKDSEQKHEGLCLIEGILQNVIGRPRSPALPLYFSVPGEPLEGGDTLSYHTGIIQSYLEGLGYYAKPINEGLAVVMAELADNDFTGIGVSIGGSMCHVCLAYLSIPVVSFSIPKAGDYIDKQVSDCTGELLYKVKAIRLNDFSLATKPTNQTDRALRIYYDDVVQAIVTGMENRFRNVELPFHNPIPLIFSGGVIATEGLLAVLAKALSSTKLPVEFSRIQQATDPLTSVARGALVKAMFEEL